MINHQLRNQHLLWRAGFGPAAAEKHTLSHKKPEAIFDRLLNASEKQPDLFDVADPDLKIMLAGKAGGMEKMMRLSVEEKKFFRRQSVVDISKLNIRWLQEMTNGADALREKMSLFWHGHFATKTVNIIYDQQLLNIIRVNALGNFRDLLQQVSRSASMIQFLNNNQNKKGHPNENFARELMELFTLGRGHYSETDVKESARAFTGWGINVQGSFEFRPRQHDDGIKTFFGKSGSLTGDQILDILLEQKQTAVFIAQKIYRYFVNENPDPDIVNKLASRFYQSGYDIRELIIDIFTSSWFYDEKNIGSQIKSPVLWMVGMQRQLPMKFQNPAAQIILERLLGQVLFAPPNVAGWPGGKHWIDSSSLMLRLQIPKTLYNADIVLSQPKDDDDLMMGMREQFRFANPKKNRNPGLQIFQVDILWNEYMESLDGIKDNELYGALSGLLLQRNLAVTEKDMIHYLNQTDRETTIQSITIRLMGTPEYQLC